MFAYSHGEQCIILYPRVCVDQEKIEFEVLLQPRDSFRETVNLEPGPQGLQHLIYSGACGAEVDFTLRQAEPVVHRDSSHLWARGATKYIVQSILDLAWVYVEDNM